MTEPTQGPAPEQPAAPPTCPRHPGTVSYVRCQRCERPTCPACQVPAPVGVWCVDCSKAAEQQARASRPGVYRKRSGPPLVTFGLIGANVAFYLYGLTTGSWEWWARFGFIPALTDTEPWRWVTSAFIHFGILHLGLNMFVLYQFGSALERVLGRARFAAIYGAAILGGSLVIDILAAPGEIHGGASGGVFGLLAATAVLLYRNRQQWQSLAVTAGLWLAAGFIVQGISWQGHLGGGLAGAAAVLAIEWWDRRRAKLRSGGA